MSKADVKRIADAITDRTLAQSVGVSLHSVRNARWKGVFPASWYPVIRGICRDLGEECSEDAFNFKSPSSASALEAGLGEGSLPTQKPNNPAQPLQGQRDE